jgi:transcriptional regulator with XRE-family HTH domain
MTTKIPKSKLQEMRISMGATLRDERYASLLSQDEFSELSGLSQSTISKIENGKFAFSIDIINIYMSVLGKKINIC